MDSAVASRLVLEAAISYEQDYERIRSGDYREPWDMVPGHRQSSPINVVTQTGRFIQEAIGTLGRRARMREADKEVWISDSDFAPGLYPDYYKNAFHYQTDGWMSRESADVYETSTETLFLGRQDSMQRTSLPALLTFARKKINEEGDRSSPNRPLRVLEVACGTGRFMTFVRDNLPLRTKYTAVDLSPFYLDAARENDSYWRKTRRDQDKLNRGAIEPARLIQAQAENLPFEDESFDAVVCVYLFHELPRKVREQAAAEMARVVAPGGAVIFTDSIQRGDRPALDEGLKNFEKMNEPYYVDYSEDDLSSHFEKAGLKPKTKIVMSTTKSLSFEKPEE
jgi:ubiquinone/menaquinone biosynthesis C-methylase UbiE